MSEKDCVFCRIAEGKEKYSLVAESDSFMAIKDIRPASDGHTLIIPREHFETLLDMPDNLSCEMIQFVKKVASYLMQKRKGTGFNIIVNNFEAAGQDVMHVKIHIIPRKKGDGIKFLTGRLTGLTYKY